MMRVLALFGTACLIAACKKPVMAPEDFCAKLEAVEGAPLSAGQKDLCLAQFGGAGPNMKGCLQGCIERATSESDFKACTSVCNGQDRNEDLARQAHLEAQRKAEEAERAARDH